MSILVLHRHSRADTNHTRGHNTRESYTHACLRDYACGYACVCACACMCVCMRDLLSSPSRVNCKISKDTCNERSALLMWKRASGYTVVCRNFAPVSIKSLLGGMLHIWVPFHSCVQSHEIDTRQENENHIIALLPACMYQRRR